jgi:hypothetical protein
VTFRKMPNSWGLRPVNIGAQPRKPKRRLTVGRSHHRTSDGIAEELEQRLHVFDWPAQHRAFATLHNRALNQVRMLDHQRNDFIVREFAATQTKFFIYRLAGAQELARLDLHLGDQISQLFLRERLSVVVNLLKWNAALPEQPVQFSTLRSSRLFVNCDFVAHSFLLTIGLWAWAFGLGFWNSCLQLSSKNLNDEDQRPKTQDHLMEIFRALSSLPPLDPPPGCKRRFSCPCHSVGPFRAPT